MDNKRCYIFAGSPDAKCRNIIFDDERYVICADGGLRHALRLGIEPDVIIGDFDTYKAKLPDKWEIIKYPPEKDDTDTMLAVKLALSRGYKNITICGGLGGRLDHTFANIQALRYILRHGGNGELVDDSNVATMQGPGVKVYSRLRGYYCSLFSFGDECSGITATGFKYPLKNGVLKNSFPLGASNVVTGKSGVISIEKGTLLVIFSKDVNQK